jgi:pimeloyl-ACP methyl ester carboxylesterase
VLLLRGVETDVLPKATADDMVRRGPKATLVEFPGIGHAPALNVPEQIGLIERFLAG